MNLMKESVWEEKFSDNFQPNFLERTIKRFEMPRGIVINSLLPKEGGTVLDLACGNGECILNIAPRFKKVIGLDIAKNRIKKAKLQAKKLHVDNSIFLYCDIDKGIPLKNNSVDFVICEASLSYFYDLKFIFSEVYRVIKQDGSFIIEVPNFAFITRRLALLTGKMPKTSSFRDLGDGGALHYFTYKSLMDFVKENGFKVTKITNSGILPELRKVYPELLAGDIIYVCKKQK